MSRQIWTLFALILCVALSHEPIAADAKSDRDAADTARQAARRAADAKLSAEAADFNELRRAVPAMRALVARLRTELWYDATNKRMACLRDLEAGLKNARTEVEDSVNPDRKKEWEAAVQKEETAISTLKKKLLDPAAEAGSGVEGVPTDIDSFDKLEAALLEADKKLGALRSKLGALADDLDKAEASYEKADCLAENLWALDEIVMGPESASLSSDGGMRSGTYGLIKFWVSRTKMVRSDSSGVTISVTLSSMPQTLKAGEKLKVSISGVFEGDVPEGVPGPPGDADVSYVDQPVLDRRKYGTPPHTKANIHCYVDKATRSKTAEGEITVSSGNKVAFVVAFSMWNTGGWVAFRYRRALEIA